MTELFESAEFSHVGLVRKANEDSAISLPHAGVFCVADGMGGGVDGDVASQTVVGEIRSVFGSDPILVQKNLAAYSAGLIEATTRANSRIKSLAEERQIRQMGSTMVAMVIDPTNPRRAEVLHVGDSRLYRWRKGVLAAMTTDHTVGQSLSAKPGCDPSLVPARIQSELLRAVGLKESIQVDGKRLDVQSEDLFLLCSDGLTRMLPDGTISEIIQKNLQAGVHQLARILVDAANNAGGKDNITVILIRFGELVSRGTGKQTDPGDGESTRVHDSSVVGIGRSDRVSSTRETQLAGVQDFRSTAVRVRRVGWLKRVLGSPSVRLAGLCIGIVLVTALLTWYRGPLLRWFDAWINPVQLHGIGRPGPNQESTPAAARNSLPSGTRDGVRSGQNPSAGNSLLRNEDELRRLDEQLEVLLVQFGVLNSNDDYIQSPLGRTTKPLGLLPSEQARNEYLSAVARMRNQYELAGLLAARERTKYIEDLKVAIQNRESRP